MLIPRNRQVLLSGRLPNNSSSIYPTLRKFQNHRLVHHLQPNTPFISPSRAARVLWNKPFFTRHKSFKQNDHGAQQATDDTQDPFSSSTSQIGLIFSLLLLYFILADGKSNLVKYIKDKSIRLGSKASQTAHDSALGFVLRLSNNTELGRALLSSFRQALNDHIGNVVNMIHTDLLKSQEFESMMTSWFTEKAIEVCNDNTTQDAMADMIQQAIERPIVGDSVQKELEKLLASEETRCALAEALNDALNRSTVQDSASKMGKSVIQTVARDSDVQSVLAETMWTVFKRTIIPRWGSTTVTTVPIPVAEQIDSVASVK